MEDNHLAASCRCCITDSTNVIYVFDILDEFDSKVSALLFQYGEIQITEKDSFSKHICIDCLNDLVTAARFKLRCKRSEDVMRLMAVQKETAGHLEVHIEEEEEYEDGADSVFDEDVTDENIRVKEEIMDTEPAFIQMISEPVPEPEPIPKQIDVPVVNPIIAEESYEQVEYLEGDPLVHETIVEENVQYLIAQDAESVHENSGDVDDFELDVEAIQHILKNEGSNLEFDIVDLNIGDDIELQEGEDVGVYEEKENKRSEVRFLKTKPLHLSFSCDYCGAGFAHLKNLRRHLTTHQMLLYCQLCSLSFGSEDELKTHNEAHGDFVEEEILVDPDLVELNQILDYEIHKQEKQNPKKTHPCTMCEMKFVSNSALTSHIRVHTGEKPFPCKFCTKKFATVGGLELHERRHNGIKPFKCDICDRGFTESSNLKVHRRIHTGEKPHVCTFCGRAFARVFLLQIHQRTHTGEKPFNCDKCSKCFTQQGDLAAHKRTHTHERPHVCKICNKAFIKSSGLTQHRRKHDKTDSNKATISILDEMGQVININSFDLEIVDEEQLGQLQESYQIHLNEC